MAVKIRLRRMGAKKTLSIELLLLIPVLQDGRFIEEIGYYNPLTDPKTIKIDDEKANQWLNNGAKPTDTVDRLFKENGIYE